MTRNIDSSGFEQGGGGERRRERRWSLWSVRAVVVDAIDIIDRYIHRRRKSDLLKA
jgi:hypothetical protein